MFLEKLRNWHFHKYWFSLIFIWYMIDFHWYISIFSKLIFINIVIFQKNKIKHSGIFPCDYLDLRSRMCNLRWYLINNARQQCTRGDSADNLSRYQRRLNNGVDNTPEIYCSWPLWRSRERVLFHQNYTQAEDLRGPFNTMYLFLSLGK